MFAQPIDPERDNVPTYLQVVQRPMDLGTVRQKLETDQYRTIQQWKDDVEQVWENSYHFNGRQALVSILAKQLQQLFREQADTLTENSISDWVNEMDRLRHEVDQITKLGPKPTVIQKSPSNTMATRHQSEPVRRKTDSVVIPAPQPLPPPPKKFTDDEITELAEEVNQIDDPDQIAKIVAIIKKYEPHLATSGEELEIDVSKLRQVTLSALKTLVSKFI
jgi:hypothetical protein